MSFTFSNSFETGSKAPDFSLTDTVTNSKVTLSKIPPSNATVIMFICNHCPYVIHVKEELVKVANDYAAKGVTFIAISSNDAEAYPQDGPQQMRADAIKYAYPFPYLYDESQMVAKSYRAACTPDLYVFDKDLKNTYHGRLDESSPKNDAPITGRDLRYAIDQTLQNTSIPIEMQKPSSGCNIKWKSGVSPF